MDKKRQAACKPGSVHPQKLGIGRPFLYRPPYGWALAANPGDGAGCPCGHPEGHRRSPLFGLAPGGVCHASPVAGAAVRSYRTLSPLPPGRSATVVCSLWHFPWGRPRRQLTGTVFPWSPDFPLVSAGADPSGRPAAWRGPVMPRPTAWGQCGWLSGSPCNAATAASTAIVSGSASPSTRVCRHRRWKAVNSNGSGRSVR